MANPHETSRQDVEEKTSEEFVRLERHDLHAVVIGIVPPPESDATVTVIRRGDHSRVRHDACTARGSRAPVRGRRRAAWRTPPMASARSWAERSAAKASASGQIGGARCEGEAGPSWKARRKAARYFARNTIDNARTGNRNDDRPVIHRDPSAARAPPVTRQCKWRCCDRFCPHVCRIAVMPIVPPRCRGSRPKVSSVSAAARKRSV